MRQEEQARVAVVRRSSVNVARQFLFASPRTAARQYIKDVNRLHGTARSGAALLFDDTAGEMVVLSA